MPQWLEIMLRTLSSVVVMFIVAKLLGKRQISQLSLFEYITGISIGNIAGYISMDTETQWYLGFVAIGTWALISVGMEYATMKSRAIGGIVDGKGTVLIKNGSILEKNLFKEKLTLDELLEQLRKKSIFKVSEIEFAVMEKSGEINALLKKENQPLTPSMLGWKMSREPETQTVMMDGQVLQEPLQETGLDEDWLRHELSKLKVKPENVFLAQVDAKKQLTVQTGSLDGSLEPNSLTPRQQLLATLQQAKADLDQFGHFARTDEEREALLSGSRQLDQVIRLAQPELK
ncbi:MULTISPECIES: DUF421 domain-containing protein [unclassified Paenibacillus]|uniref:DUF421 domain-containing protein n=1 Tax=unclassified Paenibacillus TaxID=185978 RepID=UPI00095593CE|nr:MULTISPECIES: DUF421 domain-containing protein [unclassified Paenibacillus]ASS68519.1 DUF421 domain-containing protein [Paenibacillus sp. RUD330]SIR35922.1 Uncharacterized membrane protein YcaP, DUF421 family [Paenibacillus sp. RU4X]SIR46592.1 Uncharacterized membrane protein YcaP, DUF421 family [Paenibacillus sp. RU4T]